MSYRLIDMAWKARGIQTTAKTVLVRLCGFADDDGGNVFPGLRRVADDCGLSERAVREQFRHLEEIGLLALVEEGDPRSHRPRTYRVVVERLETMNASPPPGEQGAPAPGTTCPTLGHDVPHPGAPDAPPPGTTCPSPGAPRAPKKSVRKIIERSAGDSVISQAVNDQSQGDDPEKRFEELWAAYPSRGDNPNPRKPAREKFLKLVKAGTAPDEIIRGALGYAAAMKRKQQAPEYIQQAVTWLNQAGWQQYASPQANAPPHAARRQAAAESVFDLVNTQ